MYADMRNSDGRQPTNKGMQTFVERNDRNCPGVWSPQIFNPTQLDTDQWVAAASSWGAKYFVLVADHFSGFSTCRSGILFLLMAWFSFWFVSLVLVCLCSLS